MSDFQKSIFSLRARLNRLADTWAEKKRGIEKINCRMAALGYPETMPSSLFGRFTKFLKQVALLTEKERDIISEIDAVERKHNFLRKSQKLKRAKPYQDGSSIANDNGKNDMWRRRLMWWFFFFLVLMLTQKRALKPAPQQMLKAG